MKYFYSHIVASADISIAIADMDIPKEDRIKLVSLAEETLHHTILDLVLSHLSEDEKKEFLSHISSDKHETAWEFIVGKVENIEAKILKSAEKLKKDLHKDIKATK